MRILWLNANLLVPLDKGGKLRTWHLMRHLARRHEITYLSFAHPDEPQAHVDEMREVCANLVTVPLAPLSKNSLRFRASLAAHLLDPLPYAVARYRSREYAAAVRRRLEQGLDDLVVCDFLVPAVNLPNRLHCPSVLFTHNVEADIWRRHTETQTSRLRRWLFRQQWVRMRRFERHTLSRFDRVLAVSDADRETFARLYPGALSEPAIVIPTGVDTQYFASPVIRPRPDHLVFTGSMDWLPNEDAMVYFVREILPRIRRSVPEATLSVVGRDPTTLVQALGREPGIEVTGRVADVRPEIGPAAVYVVPLRIGGGTRLKIFEAMAMGRAVVSTTVGAEGLPVTNGRDIVLADRPEDFAAAVTDLLRNEARREAIGRAARMLVTERYDWSSVAGRLEEALQAATGRRTVEEEEAEATEGAARRGTAA